VVLHSKAAIIEKEGVRRIVLQIQKKKKHKNTERIKATI
jgi:hypothetical protein